MNTEITRKGFLEYHVLSDQYRINWRESASIAISELLLKQILAARPYMRGKLLDVGCGKRPYSLIYEKLVDESVGTEVTYSPHGLSAADIICRGEMLPFPDQSFDTILCTEVLEHTTQPFLVVNEFARLLKSGGHVILSVPFIHPVHEPPYDYWRFTTFGLKQLCQSANLDVLYVDTRGGFSTSLINISTNIFVRAINMFSKGLKASPPLRDRWYIRYMLSVPQWLLLPLLKSARPPSQLDEWFAAGCFAVARKP